MRKRPSVDLGLSTRVKTDRAGKVKGLDVVLV
jgi:hypothetical protein